MSTSNNPLAPTAGLGLNPLGPVRRAFRRMRAWWNW